MDLKAQKRRIRREVRARVLAMDPADRVRQQAGLDRGFAELPGFREAATVLLYASAFPEEVETGGMLRAALALGKRLILPRVDPADDRLRLHEVVDPDRDLVLGGGRIAEPEAARFEVSPRDVDWVLVPGLAFDRSGNRLGRGKGHYDRLLSAIRHGVGRWAVAFEVQLLDQIPTEPHDRPTDGVLIADPRKSEGDAATPFFPLRPVDG